MTLFAITHRVCMTAPQRAAAHVDVGDVALVNGTDGVVAARVFRASRDQVAHQNTTGTVWLSREEPRQWHAVSAGTVAPVLSYVVIDPAGNGSRHRADTGEIARVVEGFESRNARRVAAGQSGAWSIAIDSNRLTFSAGEYVPNAAALVADPDDVRRAARAAEETRRREAREQAARERRAQRERERAEREAREAAERAEQERLASLSYEERFGMSFDEARDLDLDDDEYDEPALAC